MHPCVIHVDGWYSSPCGYCKHRVDVDRKLADDHVELDAVNDTVSTSTDGQCRESFGLHAMTPMDACMYDRLLQRNWRRCGSLFYWPRNSLRSAVEGEEEPSAHAESATTSACCPQYAIRLEATRFMEHRRTRQHARVLRKFQRYCEGRIAVGKPCTSTEEVAECAGQSPLDMAREAARKVLAEAVTLWMDSVPNIRELLTRSSALSVQDLIALGPSRHQPAAVLATTVAARLFGMARQPATAEWNPTAIADQIVATLKADSALVEQLSAYILVDGIAAATKSGHINLALRDKAVEEQTQWDATAGTIRDAQRQQSQTSASRQLRLVVTPSSKRTSDEFPLYQTYQHVIHGDALAEVSERGYRRFLCESALSTDGANEIVSGNPKSLTINVQMESAADVHKLRFIIGDRVLADIESASPLLGYGSYHIRYELVEDHATPQLMAVSVVDILPTGMSSVYFFYDSQFAELSPGVLSALVEIELIAELQRIFSEFQFYYMGCML